MTAGDRSLRFGAGLHTGTPPSLCSSVGTSKRPADCFECSSIIPAQTEIVFLFLSPRLGFFKIKNRTGRRRLYSRRFGDFKTRRRFIFFPCNLAAGSFSPIERPGPGLIPSLVFFFVGSHGRHKWTKQTSESTSPVSLWILGVRNKADIKYIEGAVWWWKVNPDEIGSASPNPLLLFCCTGREWGVGNLANK